MTQEKAVQLYTGSHWRVEAATLADVEHFTKFAVSLTAHALTYCTARALGRSAGRSFCTLSGISDD